MTRYFWPLLIGLTFGFIGAHFMPEAHGQSREDVITIINVSADRHRVDPDAMGRILWCESRWRAGVTGPEGSMGIAQYQPVTWSWASAGAGWQGFTPYHAEAAIDTMAWLLRQPEGWRHWSACYR